TPVPATLWPARMNPEPTAVTVIVVPDIDAVNEANTQLVDVMEVADDIDDIEQNPSGTCRMPAWACASCGQAKAATKAVERRSLFKFMLILVMFKKSR